MNNDENKNITEDRRLVFLKTVLENTYFLHILGLKKITDH